MPDNEMAPTNTHIEDKPAYWGDVSDPRYHDPSNFQYLVHSMSVKGTPMMADTYARQDAASYGLSEDEVAAQKTDLLKEPERLNERVTLSASLIDDKRRHTWRSGGIILGVPSEDVHITAPFDASTTHGSVELLKRHNETLRQARLTPAELLEQTPETGRNEVAIAAGNAALLGFFSVTYKTKNSWGFTVKRDLDPDTARLMKGHAKRLKLPYVRIPQGEKPKPIRIPE